MFKYRKPLLSFIGITIIIATALRLYKINRALGGNDENAMLLYFGYSPLKYITTTYHDANNHVFHTILVHLMASWFGDDNALAIRFPTLLFGISGLVIIYVLALKLFQSKLVAVISLWIATIHPVHIHYSQTARGYSLIMFFSALMIYLAIKILESENHLKWSATFILCGVLSIYTLPTNVHFLAGLAGWIVFIAIFSKASKEFSLSPKFSRKTFTLIGLLGGAIGVLSCLVYFPILGQMMETAKNHPLLTWDASKSQLLNLVPSTVSEILKGPLIWFFPFVIVGLFWGETRRNCYKILPVFIFLLPFFITIFTGVAGYPRNYLFNFPVWIIFLAGGLVAAGNSINHWWSGHRLNNIVLVSLLLVLTITMLQHNFNHYYPSLKIADGIQYKNNIQKLSKPNDLIIVADSKNFLYARTIHKKNFLNILKENKLTGINFVFPNEFKLGDYKVFTGTRMDPILKNVFREDRLNLQDVSGGKSMVGLTRSVGFPILSENFESHTNWKTIQGRGELKQSANHWITGGSSIMLKADPGKDFIVHSDFGKKIEITNPSLMVLTWAQTGLENRNIIFNPILEVEGIVNEKTLSARQVLTGMINDGMDIRYQDRLDTSSANHWLANVSLGKLPSGVFSFRLILKVDADKTVFYDSLRLFVVEISDS